MRTYNFRVKPVNFEFEWTIEDDSRLLKGIYQYGMGSWEQITIDEKLQLGNKINLNDTKISTKRIQARAEYLLKIIKKQVDMRLGVVGYI